MNRLWTRLMAVAFLLQICALALAEDARFNIPAQPLPEALKTFAEQAKMQLLYKPDAVSKATSNAVVGDLDKRAALELLLKGTGFEVVFSKGNAATVRPVEVATKPTSAELAQVADLRLAQGEDQAMQKVENTENKNSSKSSVSAETEHESSKGIPEILVRGTSGGRGSRALNMDIRRTENDAQPYVVFEHDKIAQSGATTLEEFFRNELTMSISAATAAQSENIGTRSSINLRGLGADETLILIDGRRVAGFNYEGRPEQANINSIPVAAIERVEVLPTTASGIYGGGATGGAINVVLRRDYSGIEGRLTYGNSFESDVSSRRIDLSAGFNFEEGRSNVLLAGSYSTTNPLLVLERNLAQRGRQHILEQSPASLFASRNPPLGATPNIRSSNGQSLVFDDGTPLNSPITFIPRGYEGVHTDSGLALLKNAGQYNLELAETAQSRGGARYGLLNTTETESLMVTLRREFTEHVSGFAEFHASDSSANYSANFADITAVIPGAAPNNPFQQEIRVTVPAVGLDQAVESISEDRRVVVGAIVKLPKRWRAALDYTWNRSRSAYVKPSPISAETMSTINAGFVDVLRDLNTFPVQFETGIPSSTSPGDFTLRNTSLRLAGPLPWVLPGGAVVLSFLAEHRAETLDEMIVTVSQRQELVPDRSQSVDSVYLEVRLPFLSERNRVKGGELLELQIAARHDDYRVTGATERINVAAPSPVVRVTNERASLNPTIGFRYKPASDLMVRASYGTGYRPPSMIELVPSVPFPVDGSLLFRDPLRGNETVGVVEFLQGGNPNLRPERSKSLSMGLVLTPRVVPTLRIAADWTKIAKTGNFSRPLSGFTQVAFEQLLNNAPERVTRSDPSGGFAVGPITGIDNTLINMARLKVEAVDIALEYQLKQTKFGVLDLSSRATYLVSLETQATVSEAAVQNAGVLRAFDSTAAGGLRWKVNTSLNWTFREWSLGWRTRFFDSYFFDATRSVNAAQGSNSVPSQLYHDVVGTYRFASSSESKFSFLADTEIQLGINNIFNKVPPIDVVSSSGTGGLYSYLGDPRLANYYLSIRKSFSR